MNDKTFELLSNLLTDFSIKLGEYSDRHVRDLENEIRKCAAEYCSGIDDDVLRLVLFSSKEAYYRALDTVEQSLKSLLEEQDEDA